MVGSAVESLDGSHDGIDDGSFEGIVDGSTEGYIVEVTDGLILGDGSLDRVNVVGSVVDGRVVDHTVGSFVGDEVDGRSVDNTVG